MNTKPRFKAEESSSSSIMRFFDILTICGAMYLSLKLHDQVTTIKYIMLLTTVLVVYLYTAESVQLYRSLRINRFAANIWLVMFSLFVAFSAMLGLSFALKISEDYSRLVVGGWFALSFTFLTIWRLVARIVKNNLHKHGISTKRVAIVGCTDNAFKLIHEIKHHPEHGLIFSGVFDDRTAERLQRCSSELRGTVEDCVDIAREGHLDILYITLPLSADKRIADIIQQL